MHPDVPPSTDAIPTNVWKIGYLHNELDAVSILKKRNNEHLYTLGLICFRITQGCIKTQNRGREERGPTIQKSFWHLSMAKSASSVSKKKKEKEKKCSELKRQITLQTLKASLPLLMLTFIFFISVADTEPIWCFQIRHRSSTIYPLGCWNWMFVLSFPKVGSVCHTLTLSYSKNPLSLSLSHTHTHNTYWPSYIPRNLSLFHTHAPDPDHRVFKNPLSFTHTHAHTHTHKEYSTQHTFFYFSCIHVTNLLMTLASFMQHEKNKKAQSHNHLHVSFVSM